MSPTDETPEPEVDEVPVVRLAELTNAQLAEMERDQQRELDATRAEIRQRVLMADMGMIWGTLHPGGDVWPHDSPEIALAQSQGDGSIVVMKRDAAWEPFE